MTSMPRDPEMHGSPGVRIGFRQLREVSRLKHLLSRGLLRLVVALTLLGPFEGQALSAPTQRDPLCGSLPISSTIVAGPDRNLWFVARCLDSVGKITPTGKVTFYKMPQSDTWSSTIVVGPRKTLWFTEPNVGRVGRIKVNGKVTDFPLPPESGVVNELGVGPDGNVWGTEGQNQALDRITYSGQITRHILPISDLSLTSNIITGPDHNIWLINTTFDQMSNYSLAGVFHTWQVPAAFVNNDIGTMVAGPQGTLWVTRLEYHLVQVFYLSHGKLLTKITYTLTDTPRSIARGPNNTMWVTQTNPSQFDVLSLDSPLPVALPFPNMPNSAGLTLGSDHAMWLMTGNTIDRITSTGLVTSFAVPSTAT